jgi:hypothetical protein
VKFKVLFKVLFIYIINKQMSKIVQIKIFNDILDQFLDFLESNFLIFRSDIILTKSTIDFIRRSNPRLVVEQYMSYVAPYEKNIFECDEDFFLNFDTNLKQIGLTSDDILFGSKIRNIWLSSEITNNQKAYIWLYFQKLLRAGKKIM